MAAELAHHRKALRVSIFVHRGAHIAQQPPRLHRSKACLQRLLGFLHQAALLVGHLADAEHARGVGIVAIQDGGAVDVDDITVFQHIVGRRDAVADHFVDGRADAFRIALVIKVCRDASMLDGVIINPFVDLLGANACADPLGHEVQYADVDGSAFLDALDLLRRFQQAALGNLEALLIEALQALVEIEMALLVFAPAAAPAFVVTTGAFQIIVHTASFRLRSIVTLLAMVKS